MYSTPIRRAITTHHISDHHHHSRSLAHERTDRSWSRPSHFTFTLSASVVGALSAPSSLPGDPDPGRAPAPARRPRRRRCWPVGGCATGSGRLCPAADACVHALTMRERTAAISAAYANARTYRTPCMAWHWHLIHRLQRGGVRTTYYYFTGGSTYVPALPPDPSASEPLHQSSLTRARENGT